MFHLSWLLSVFRRFLAENYVLRRSFRGILFLWAILRRHLTKRGSPANSDSTVRAPTKQSHYTHDWQPSNGICASSIPLHLRVHSLELQEFPTSIDSAAPLNTSFPLSHTPTHQSSCTIPDLAVPTSYLGQYPPHDVSVPTRSSPHLPSLSESHPVLGEADVANTSLAIINSLDNGSDLATPAGLRPQELQVTPPAPRRILEPTTSSMIQDYGRYERNVVIPKTRSEFMVPLLTTDFHRENVPPDWTAITHPEGNLYFYHRSKRIFTNAYLCDENTRLCINDIIQQLEDEITAKNISLEPTWECVLELNTNENGDFECGYYLVDHRHRCLLWLEDFDISHLITDVKGITSPSHIKHEIEALYWVHWELFPNFRIVTQDIVDELQEILLHASADCLTSKLSTIPYSTDDLDKMLRIVDRMKFTMNKDPDTFISVEEWCSHSACVIGRFMATFTHHKFLHFYGQNGARLSRDQSVHTNATPQRSLLIKLLSPLLFSAPDVHLKALETIWVDETVNEIPWNDFIGKLNTDWQEYTLFATVLLNANVAFLAIGSVDQTFISHVASYISVASNVANVGGAIVKRSPTQLASYLSVASSVGSIILGLLLLRQNRTKDRNTATAASDFLKKWSHASLGLETLAIMYSLPYALLMWGMLSFLVAFSCMWFQHSDRMTYGLIGGFSLAIVLLIIWCVVTSWESEERYWWSWNTHIADFCKWVTTVERSEGAWKWPRFGRRQSWDSDQTAVAV